MKNILVPTDFSENANNALRYAVNIANHFEATIHLINVYQVHSRAGMFVNVERFIRDDAEKGLSKTVKAIEELLLKASAIITHGIPGRAVDVVCKYAQQHDVDLIVMGTQGASGLKELFLGSNTGGVIQRSIKPVLAIPNGFQYQPMGNMVLAVDSEVVPNENTLSPMLQLAQAYQAHIKVLHLEKSKTLVSIDPGIEIYLNDYEHSFHEGTLHDNDLNKSINHFVEKEQANLLCMIRRKRSFFEKIFFLSATKKESFNCPVPLLVLQEEE